MNKLLIRIMVLILGIGAIFFTTRDLYASIGNVIIQEGESLIERKIGEDVASEVDLDIFSYDTIRTAKSKTAIEFIDTTRVDVTEHSKLVIDEFVYDPNKKTGKLSLKASLGTVRYASGQIAKNNPTSIKITTPTATIGVRGTDFSMTVDELGSSTIILLPSCDTNGNCYVGEISVESDAGQVILSQAFQATVVDTVSSSPMKPVILGLDENMINNLLIIARPSEITSEMNASDYNEVADALDLDFLQFDELEKDYLEEEESAWATALDIDFLEQNFLGDILKQLNEQLAKQMRNEFDKKKSSTGVIIGKDEETGIIILNEEPEWLVIRETEANYLELRLDQEYGYNINIIQGDDEIYDYEIGGNVNEITIIQSN
tara:strand:- start:1573 stop:2697 length:1125 start_codon:yes stop_codon:yes gene_type:complete